jgi:hypothetical protein
MAEAMAAAKSSSLVNDNVKQRRAKLTPKLLAHEKARCFYMPNFTPPTVDALISAKCTPLHLPSLFSVTRCPCDCPLAVVQAKIEVRHSSVATSIKDLIRHLTTRTFLHQDWVKNAIGVHADTQVCDVISGVSRRVDASAGAYRRHQVAYKKLVGPAPVGWEIDFKLLTSADVRGLSEKAVSDKEILAWYRATKLAEVLTNINCFQTTEAQTPVQAADNDQTDDPGDAEAGLVPINSAEPGVLTEALAPGEGTRKISWIWVAGLKLHDGKDTQLTDGWL